MVQGSIYSPPGGIGGDLLGVSIAPVKRFVFVDEKAPQHITAHEIGHTYGFCDEYDGSEVECGNWNDNAYEWGYPAGDGWDVRNIVGQYENDQSLKWKSYPPAKVSGNKNDVNDTALNYYSFMGPIISSFNNKNWAPSNEYEYNKYNNLR
jgi:hypothetical protein